MCLRPLREQSEAATGIDTFTHHWDSRCAGLNEWMNGNKSDCLLPYRNLSLDQILFPLQPQRPRTDANASARLPLHRYPPLFPRLARSVQTLVYPVAEADPSNGPGVHLRWIHPLPRRYRPPRHRKISAAEADSLSRLPHRQYQIPCRPVCAFSELIWDQVSPSAWKANLGCPFLCCVDVGSV